MHTQKVAPTTKKSSLFTSQRNKKLFKLALSGLIALSPAALQAQIETLGVSPIQTELTPLEELAYQRPSVFDSKPYLETGYATDRLTNGYQAWESQYVNLFLPMQQRGMFNIQANHLRRYGITDKALSVAYAYPFSVGVLNIEVGYAGNAAYLPKNNWGFSWNGRLPQNFGYTVGTLQRQYLESQSATYQLGVEKYFGNFRFAYTGLLSTINGTQATYGQLLQAQWVGENMNKIGLSYAQGLEPMVVSPGALAAIQTQYIQADGLYWLNKNVGITLSIWHGMQGDFYQRNGGQLGVRFVLN